MKYNAQFVASRLYRATDRRLLYVGIPLMFSVHPTFQLYSSTIADIEESPHASIAPETYTQPGAIEAAEKCMRGVITKALILSPLAVCDAPTPAIQ
jgi:hypothetical protein